MFPILYDETTTDFSTNGLGRLSDAISCVVEEERNGMYELTMVYPVDGIHYADIVEERIILATPSDGGSDQPFRIYQITRPFNGQVEVRAQHISYQLAKMVAMPFTATTVSMALSEIKNYIVGTCPFTFWTDMVKDGAFGITEPRQVRTVLGGTEGSFLDVFGGEYEFDKYRVYLWSERGADNGVSLRYGKNITDLNNDTDYGNVYTGIVPYWAKEDDYIFLSERVVYSTHRTDYSRDMIIPVDFSSEWDNKPTEAQLRSKAQSYLTTNKGWTPQTNIRVSFVALWQTEEYKDIAPLQRVNLCDTVSVYHERLGVECVAKVIKTTYNVLLDRYDEIELGDARKTLAQAINQDNTDKFEQALSANKSYMDAAIEHATQLIKGGLGGYVIMAENADGQPEEILIMDKPDKNQAVNVIRMNKNGIAFSNNGYNGTYRTAWTIDGGFVADFITSGKMSANIIEGGTLTLGGVSNSNGTFALKNASGTTIVSMNNTGISVTNGSISANTITSGSMSAARITSGTMQANRISGGTLTLGGANNANGQMIVNDASGNAIVTANNDGIQIAGTSSNIKTNIDKNGIKMSAGSDYNMQMKRKEDSVVFELTGEWNGYERMSLDSEGYFKAWGVRDATGDAGDSANVRVKSDGTFVHISSSSERYKTDIEGVKDDALDPHRLYELPVVQFRYKEDYIGSKEKAEKLIIGFIAEDLDRLYPVGCQYEDGQPESWSDRTIIPAMLKLIQEQNERIKKLEEQLK